MSLDVSLKQMKLTEVFSANITHNLTKMASQVPLGFNETLYDVVWRPEECSPPYTIAVNLIPRLNLALKILQEDEERLKKFEPGNGWGGHACLYNFVLKYLSACEESPGAQIGVCR